MKRTSLIALVVINFAACRGAGSHVRSDPAPGLLALNPSGIVTSRTPAPQPKRDRIPEAVLRDPAERQLLMDRLERQIERQTRQVPDDRFRSTVRPQLAAELRDAGLSPEDVEQILSGVEKTRR